MASDDGLATNGPALLYVIGIQTAKALSVSVASISRWSKRLYPLLAGLHERKASVFAASVFGAPHILAFFLVNPVELRNHVFQTTQMLVSKSSACQAHCTLLLDSWSCLWTSHGSTTELVRSMAFL